jgi:hypothetical protein
MRVALLVLTMAATSPLDALPQSPEVSDLPLRDSISIDGVTWKFSTAVPVGRFVNGDYYVVGEVTVVNCCEYLSTVHRGEWEEWLRPEHAGEQQQPQPV